MTKADHLIEVAAIESGITVSRIMGNQRNSDVKAVRAAIAWTLYQHEGLTGLEIGSLLRRKKTQVYYLVEAADRMMGQPEFRKLCDALARVYNE